MAHDWTPEQQNCLDATGTVLVSAAAGSGKTAVLVERVTRLVTDPHNPVDVDQLLVVTFTKAAAAEMKQRLATALNKKLAEHPGDRRLQRQLMLLPDAAISTVHSFCGNLIRAHFHQLPEVAPGFRVAEEAQTAPLRAEAMDEVLEESYTTGDKAFLGLLDLLGGKRDDKQLAERVELLYNFVQAHPFPDQWMDKQAALYHNQLPLVDSPFGQEVCGAAKAALNWCVQLYEHAARLAVLDASVSVVVGDLRREQELARSLIAALDAESWDARYHALLAVKFDRLTPVKKCTDEALKKRVQALRNKAKEKIQALPELLVGEEAALLAATAALAPTVDALFDLTRRFAARYAEKKRRQGLLDFNDLEHFALQLLTEPGEGDTLRRTALAEEVAAGFAHVMVDEYQDTNPTQEWLFRAVSQNEQNLFFVGDVKQSIYAFRNATPDLFIARRDRYPDYDGVHYPAEIRLSHNFRSRRGVTDTVNLLFDQLMTSETCGVTYDQGERLQPEATYPEAPEAAELILIDEAGRVPNDTADAVEARVIAARLREMKETLTVTDKEGTRPLKWGDVCLLLRSVKDHASLYVDELNRLGIPAVTGSGTGFYSAPEVMVALSLLRFLDNPLQDVSLLAVLMSPLFAFTPDDLALLRGGDKHSPLFVAVRRRARGEDALAARCRAFLQCTDRLRTLAAALPADRLLGQVYEELALPAVMGARLHGTQRMANLQQLLDIARGFEQNGFRGLSAFVRYVDRESERDNSTAPASLAEGQDAVHIMSIHASKGLEFPVVFLAGLGRQFNNSSARDALLLHRELGVGMELQNTDTLEKYDTVQRRALAQRIRRDARAEDLRVLYVALTRARERLCMVITGDTASQLTGAAAAVGSEPHLPTGAVMEAASCADWVLMALLRHPEAGFLRALAGAEGLAPLPCESHLTVQALASPPPEEVVVEELPSAAVDEDYLAALRRRLSYTYPYEALGAVPAKLAASALAHQQLGEQFVATSRPAFFSESALTPAERGTALHQFMQFANYEAAAADPVAEMRRLVRGGFLTALQGDSLPIPRLRGFFESELYQRIRRSPEVRREYAFTVERPADRCVPGLSAEAAEGETVLIQGIVDCMFQENGRWVIVDYKTDRVTTAAELADRYRPQLALYAEALEKGFSEPVGECLLYSFSLQETVPV